jgi:predicted dehydrogenase
MERARETAGTFGGTPYDDYRRMLDREQLDAVYIGVPPYAHGEPELLCIAKGLPVFVEKPVALDPAVAERIAQAAQSSDVFLFPAYKYRYSPLVQELARTLGGERIAHVDGFYNIDFAPQKQWWRTRGMSGGQMVEQATHVVDLVRLYFGEMVERCLYSATVSHPELDVPDASALMFRCNSGAIGCIRSSFAGTVSEAGLTIDTASRRITLITEWPKLKLIVREKDGEPRLLREEEEIVCRTSESELFLEAVRSRESGALAGAYRDAILTLRATL